MKRVCMFLLVLAIALPIFAAGEQEQTAGGPVTIEVWFHSGKGEEREVLNTQIDEFNSIQSEVVVKATMLPEGSYNEQVGAAALADDLPDLLDFDGPNVYNYAWSGHLIPMDSYISDDMKADLLPSILAQGEYDGKIYALGTFDSGLAIWANKAYLEKAGVRIPTSVEDRWSFAEFNDALAKLQALPEVEYAIDFKMNYGQGEWYSYGFSPIVQGFGGDLIDRNGYTASEGVINGPEAVAAMEWFQSLFENGYATIEPAGDDDFYAKKITALSLVGHWMWQPHNSGLGEDLVLLPMPEIGKKAVTGMGSWCWGITSQSKNPDATWKFLEYIMQPSQTLFMSNGNGAVPARLSALERSSLFGAGGPLEIFTQQLNTGVALPRPITPAYPVITEVFAEAVQNIVTGADVKTELDRAAAAIDQDLEDNKGYPVN
ncbi:MAG: sugar ABC transporter substrate-binding protein [Bacteroidetes bacterium]|nr:sugar ABC transporter substrate-binding protein [Bacteroidota bacterium]